MRAFAKEFGGCNYTEFAAEAYSKLREQILYRLAKDKLPVSIEANRFPFS